MLVVLGCQKAEPDRAGRTLNSGPEAGQAPASEQPETARVENHQEHQVHEGGDRYVHESIKPRLVEEVHWTPGARVTLAVELVATDESGETRVLGYEEMGNATPVAEINFLDGDLNYHSLAHVELSRRRGDGVYSAEFDLPAGARGADVIVRAELQQEGVVVEPLEIKGVPIEYDLFFGRPRYTND
jgi:hypothetical protein